MAFKDPSKSPFSTAGTHPLTVLIGPDLLTPLDFTTPQTSVFKVIHIGKPKCTTTYKLGGVRAIPYRLNGIKVLI